LGTLLALTTAWFERLFRGDPDEPPRSRIHRLASAAVVLFGGAMWVGIGLSYGWQTRLMEGTFDGFDIRGGLPRLTRLVLGVGAFLRWQPWAIGSCWAVIVLASAVLAARSDRRGAMTLAGAFVLVSFILWILAMFSLVFAYLCPMMPIHYHIRA
jgi:hypothetical protein